MIDEEVDRELTRLVHQLRDAVGADRSPKPLHWRNLRNDHAKKRRALQVLAGERLVFSAAATWKPAIRAETALRKTKGHLYNYTARLLIERLSWYADGRGRQVNLFFENRATTKYQELRHYVRRVENDPRSSVTTGVIRDVQPVNATWKGAQLADFFVGTVAEALEPDLDGFYEPGYLLTLRNQLYRGRDDKVLSAGLKLFPGRPNELERYPWLADL